MPRRSKISIPNPRLWTPEQIARRLNRSVGWFYEHLPRLRQLGFPDKDKDLGRWDSRAIEAWLDRRSRVSLSNDISEEILEAARGKN